ncbi:MAG: elongation factor P maturation arginine rhamnosyltransferase EarP [Betaproteobacteria bacterium]|nr:elongation factor P maturation arginine rhamnosyltransferase EarP [Betaproteobacteria bacterium]
MNHPLNCDLFCHVVDNFGDIGVAWRLARQLAHEHGCVVRLFVDDLNTFAAICPQIQPRMGQQTIDSVSILPWSRQQQLDPADVVVELFGCHLLPGFIERIQRLGSRRVRWVNLEHLSAEAWVEGAHLRPSPQPGGIDKLFFFPGFGAGTGGLLRERDLLARRASWERLPSARRIALRSLGLPPPPEHALTVLLFSYARAGVAGWLQAMASASRPTTLWICPGPMRAEVDAWLHMQLGTGQSTVRGSLTLCALPFVAQERFDELLWSADVCIVRGEDSFVRAQWAARPMVWHAYPQQDQAHLEKIDAFLRRYLRDADPKVRDAVTAMSEAWNDGGELVPSWQAFCAALPEIRAHARSWCEGLAAQPDLARQLLQALGVAAAQDAPAGSDPRAQPV